MQEQRPRLILVAGPNGSGKTTITHQLLAHEWGEECTYINPDNIARDVFGDWNSDDAMLKAAEFATDMRYSLLEKRQSIVFETVLSSDEKVEYVRKAKEAGYFVRMFFVCTESPVINAARVAGRYMAGGHTVPIEKIVSRYGRSLANCAKVIKSADRVYLYDNSRENQPATLLFRASDGLISKQYENNLPKWADLLARICEKQ